MTGQGFHLLLSREDAKKLFAQKEPEAIRGLVTQLIASAEYKKEGRVLDCGTSWDALHRCITDGTLDPTAGEAPINNAFLGGRLLYKTDDYIVTMVRPDMALFVAEALAELKYDELHGAYFKIDPASYGREVNEKDFEKAWIVFQQVRQFYDTAAQDLDAMVFAAKL